MLRMASFYKVSFEQFCEGFKDGDYPIEDLQKIYDNLVLPKRATKGSAGYDVYSPIGFHLAPGETIKIPTGIRVKMQEGWVMLAFPRSGLGFKYRLQLDNTIGVIDQDYYYSDNEGHIYLKITNDSRNEKDLIVNAGEGFAQFIFTIFGITDDDNAGDIRNGGFGSTTKPTN